MSEVCMYGMSVNGKKENIEKLASYMKGNEKEVLIGVNPEETDYLYLEEQDLHVINGGCNHSIELSMLGTDYSYYDEAKDKNYVTSLEKLTQKLNIKVEVSSDGGDEEFIVNKGVLESIVK